jgi:hypothetical protein
MEIDAFQVTSYCAARKYEDKMNMDGEYLSPTQYAVTLISSCILTAGFVLLVIGGLGWASWELLHFLAQLA